MKQKYVKVNNEKEQTMCLLDIMKDGRFYKQLKYTKRGIPEEIDGKIIEAFDFRELEDFVEEELPSLKGKNYRIRFSDGKIGNT